MKSYIDNLIIFIKLQRYFYFVIILIKIKGHSPDFVDDYNISCF